MLTAQGFETMKTALKTLAILCMLSGSSAWAGGQDTRNEGRGRDHGHERGNGRGEGHGYGAPEPVTMIGVALGASAAGLAGWRARRKRS